jgi:hypothetical protein
MDHESARILDGHPAKTLVSDNGEAAAELASGAGGSSFDVTSMPLGVIEPIAKGQPGKDMPPIVLAVAGLAVFDAVIVAIYVALWVINPEAMLAIISTLAGISLLLGVAPIVVGGLVLHKNRQTGTTTPGTNWAVAGIVSGMVMSLATLAIPLLAAVRMLLMDPGRSI